MAIDIRANVTCSLGDLISGSISDDYIQGNGLVKTKGSCELNGIYTPRIGQTVTFSYTSGGATKQIPRKLRVLSSFADPFRNTTKVELGCKLTYFEGVGPTPTIDGQAPYTTGRQQQCLNGYIEYPANSQVPIPVTAKGVMETCLAKLKITASRSPLTNHFNVDKFDLSQGYVAVLGDLLLSESYFGYLDENEVLQVRDLVVEGGKGPVIDKTSLIDLDQIGVGDLPGDAVVVRYDALKLTGEVDTANDAERRKRDWEEEEVISDPEEHVVRYTDSNGATHEASYSYIPYQKTVTKYGENKAFDPNVCILAGREGADLSDSPVKVETTERILYAQAATNYCSELLSAGVGINPGAVEMFKSKVVENTYDAKGELVETTEYTYEPFYKWAGGLDLQFVYTTDTGTDSVQLGSGAVLVQKVVTTRENVYAPSPSGLIIKAGEELIPVVEAQKVTTTTYTNWALTQQGQQAVAQIKDQTPFTSAGQCAAWLIANSDALVLSDGQVQINRGRDIVQGQKRASSANRIGGDQGARTETTAELAYVTGGPSSERVVSLSMPYQSDDIYSSTGSIVPGNAAAMALRYGRTQNRLLMGNRYGVNLQLHADRMPAHPFDTLYLSDGTLMVQYRANAANWAFSRDGVVASLDALFWGVAGGTGTSWVPVAPGVTTFPPLPAVDGNGETTVGSVVPPWNELTPLIATTRTRLLVSSYPYATGGTTETAALVTRTKLVAGYRLAADAGSFAFTGTAQPIKLRAGVGSFVLSGLPAGSAGHRVWRVFGTAFNVLGQDANKIRTYAPLTADAGAFVFDGKPAGKFKGTSMKADPGAFSLDGRDAGRQRTYQLLPAAANFGLSGNNATLAVAASDPLFTNVALLLHMNGADGSTNFVDSSRHAWPVAASSPAKISTTQFKFGGGAAMFGGSTTSGALSIPDAAPLTLGGSSFTIEFWVRFNTLTSNMALMSHAATSSSDASWSLAWFTGGSITFRHFANGTTGTSRTASWTPTPQTWHHFAACRDSTTFLMFVDGVQVYANASFGTAAFFDSSAPLVVGARYTAREIPLDGFMDDVRITVGSARYVAPFTPPTQPFPDF